MSFGDGSHGALGLPLAHLSGPGSDSYEPTRVPGLPSDIANVSAGHYHSLALTSQGQVWSWGRNKEFQLGHGLSHVNRHLSNEPKKVEGLNQVKVQSVSASGVISSAVGDDGSLWVWGKSKRGQLGLGKGITEAILPSRVEGLAGERIAKVSLGWGHALAQTEDGKLFGWGYSIDGRLGKFGQNLDNSTSKSTLSTFNKNQEISPSMLDAAEKLVLEDMEKEKDMPVIWEPFLIEEVCGVEVMDMACGLDHSLVLCRDGTLLSGGSDVYGQLGRAKQDEGMFPVEISFPPLSISSGLGHSLAIGQVDTAKRIITWGWNQSSQLGRKGPENLPLPVEGLVEEISISVSGGRAHSMALTSKGEVWVWGSGRNGRLGLGSSNNEGEPTLLDSLEGSVVLQAVAGFDHSLLLVAE